MSSQGQKPAELTPLAVSLGLALSVIMGAANVYLGLKAGMTVSASIPAAVIAMVIFRVFLRRSSILEANQVQTAASAGESLAAGVIFTMPAMLLIGAWEKFDPVLTAIVAFTGGLIGILFMIPMRRVFVVGQHARELKYPEGVACAAVLKAGEQKSETSEGAIKNEALAIVNGALLGGLAKFVMSFLHLAKGSVEHAVMVGKSLLFVGTDVSPALVAVGVIVGLNVAALVFIGGALAWFIELPILSHFYFDPSLSADENAWTIWSQQIRYTGVGAMIVGGIASIIQVRQGLVHAIKELKSQTSLTTEDGAVDEKERDLPSFVISSLLALSVVLVGGTYYYVTGNWGVALVSTVVMLIMSFFFTAVASYIVGLVGNSNSPVSGMTITAVLFTALMLLVFGYTGMEGMIATLGVAAIVCCAACTSGDVCNDLKTGSLVGASPLRQQIMQILGVAIASLVMAPVLQLLHDQTPGGIGGKNLSAPQAGLFASLVKGFFGDGHLPWLMVAIGILVGVVVLMIDHMLKKREAQFRLYLMPLAVGIYLPLGLSVPIFVGGLIAHFVLNQKTDTSAMPKDEEKTPGVLFASGVIAGESLMGVGIAILSSIGLSAIHWGDVQGVAGMEMHTIVAVMTALIIGLTLFFFMRQKS